MNTNDSKPDVPVEDWATVLSGTKNLPTGLPDPAVLARMANECFSAVPVPQQANLPRAETQLKAASPLVPSKPTDIQPQPATATQSTDMETDMPVPAFSGGPSFSFLEDVRPLFGEPARNSTAKPAKESGV